MRLKYIILDIDGTLTDGGIYYDDSGYEMKKFCTKDGTGIILMKSAGITPIVLTGRECEATKRRMAELGVFEVYQNVKDKAEWIKKWMKANNIDSRVVGYIGDDLNDLPSMKLCSFVACPSDAIDEVKKASSYITKVNGGQGVVREVIIYLLKEEGNWEEVLIKAYGCGN